MRQDHEQVADGDDRTSQEVPPSSAPCRLSTWLPCILAVALVSIVILGAASFIVSSSTGFDLTDEAFYILDARRPEDQFAAPRLHWLVTAPLLRAVGGNLSLHRIAGAAMLLGAGAMLGLALSRLLNGLAPEEARVCRRVAAAAAGAASSATFYGFAVRTPGYNWASLLLTTSTLALIVWSVFRPRPWWIGGIGGLAAGLAMLPKVSTGVLLAASGLAASLIVGSVRDGVGGALRRSIAWFLSVLLGAAIGLGVLWAWGDPIETFRAGAEMLAPTALYGGLGDRLLAETVEMLELWWLDAWLAVLVAAGIAALAGGLSILGRANLAAVLAVAGLPISVAIFGFLECGWPELPPRSRMVLVAATILAASWIPQLGTSLVWKARPRGERPILIGMLTLILMLPLMTAAGTGNADYWRFASFGFWLLAASLPALHGLVGVPSLVVVACTGLVAVTALASALVVRAPQSAPYRPPADASGDLEAIEVYTGSGPIEIDRELAASIRELRRLAADSGMSAGQDILACFDMPGLVLTLDGRAPGTSWLFSGYLRSDLAAARALASVPEARRRDAWVLVRSPQRAEARKLEGATPDLATLFATIGRKWPEDYMPVGSVRVPFYDRTAEVTLWRPRCIATPYRGDAQIPAAVESRSSDPSFPDLAGIDRVRSAHGGGAESGDD